MLELMNSKRSWLSCSAEPQGERNPIHTLVRCLEPSFAQQSKSFENNYSSKGNAPCSLRVGCFPSKSNDFKVRNVLYLIFIAYPASIRYPRDEDYGSLMLLIVTELNQTPFGMGGNKIFLNYMS